MQHVRMLAVCATIGIIGVFTGRSVIDAQQPAPLPHQLPTPATLYCDSRTPISSIPFTIDERGSYFLTACMTGEAAQNGITIAADNVTLDLNGFSLIGVAGSLDGVHVEGAADNIVIRNGLIREWDGDGVHGEETCQLIRLHAVDKVQASPRSPCQAFLDDAETTNARWGHHRASVGLLRVDEGYFVFNHSLRAYLSEADSIAPK